MTLGQMRAVIEYAEQRIDSFAVGNEAFDRDRARWRQSLEVTKSEEWNGLTAFDFKLRDEFYTIVLDRENEIVHTAKGK